MTESPTPWGGSEEEYEHHNQASRIFLYLPPEKLQEGPLDFYIIEEGTSRDKLHLVNGPEYRKAVTEVFDDNQDRESKTVRSICGLKKIYLGFNGGLPHFLELLAKIGFDGIKTTVPDLHNRPGDTGYRMISGSPLTVYQTCCTKCKNSYTSQYTTEEVESEVRSLTGK